MIYYFEVFIMPFIIAIIGGIISSGIWWLITRSMCFPSFDISKKINALEHGMKTIEIKNTSKRYGGYDIVCYGEYYFSYKGRIIKYPLSPKSLYYLKAGDSEDINVKIPSKATIDNVSLENAFYQSNDGVLNIRLVYQNKFGVKRSFALINPVKKEPIPYQELSSE